MFEALGVPVIDTDVIAREVVAPGQTGLAAVQAAFGDAVLSNDGSLDRAALRSVVFSDERQRRRLEAILHPLIQDQARRQSAVAGGDYQIIVVPLLVGSPLQAEMDRILLVDCDENTQIQRLMARDGGSEAEARRILAAQSSRGQRLKIADEVVSSSVDLAQTRYLIGELHGVYEALAASR